MYIQLEITDPLNTQPDPVPKSALDNKIILLAAEHWVFYHLP